jgi:hypothetical protein
LIRHQGKEIFAVWVWARGQNMRLES